MARCYAGESCYIEEILKATIAFRFSACSSGRLGLHRAMAGVLEGVVALVCCREDVAFTAKQAVTMKLKELGARVVNRCAWAL